MSTTCGLWLTLRQLTAVVVNNDPHGRVAARYTGGLGADNTSELLSRVAFDHGLGCSLVMAEILSREPCLTPWLQQRCRSLSPPLWLAPKPIIIAVAHLMGSPCLARSMAAALARLPQSRFFQRHLRKDTQLHLFATSHS